MKQAIYLQVSVTFDENTTTNLPTLSSTFLPEFDRPPDLDPMLMERTIIFLGLWPVIVIFGIFGNIMTLIVLFRVNETNTTSIYLKNLAVADIFTLSIKGACTIFTWWQLFLPHQYRTWKFNTLSLVTFSYIFEKVSKYITVAVVFERIIAVTWPFRYKEICTPLRTRIVILVIYIICLAISLPVNVDMVMYFHTAEPIADTYPMTVKEGTRYLTKHLFNHDLQFLITKIYRAVDFIPIPLIIIGNCIIIMGLRKAKQIRTNSTDGRQQGRKRERQITKLCLTISFTFLILCSPFDMYYFLFFTKVIELNHIVQVVGDVFTTLSTMNSSANFIIYAAMNKRYRQGYLEIITCLRQQAEPNTPSMQVNVKDGDR